MHTSPATSLLKKLALCALLVLCALAGPSLAEVVQSHYTTLRGSTAPSVPTHLDGISTVDTNVWTSPVDPIETLGNPAVAAQVEGTVSGGTICVATGLYFKKPDATYTFLGISAVTTVTLTTTTEKNGSLYIGTAVPTFDTRGAPYYDVRVMAISNSGAATVRPWVYGAKSQGKP